MAAAGSPGTAAAGETCCVGCRVRCRGGHCGRGGSSQQPGGMATPELLLCLLATATAFPCNSSLGLSSGQIKDSQLTASSSFSPATVGAENGRLGTERGGGAWCPASLVQGGLEGGAEWLQVELGRQLVLAGLVVQGRYAGGQGQEFTEWVVVRVWDKQRSVWVEQRDTAGRALIPANRDTYSKVEILLQRPVVTDKVRLVPVSQHPRMVCLRMELLGCSGDKPPGPPSAPPVLGDTSDNQYKEDGRNNRNDRSRRRKKLSEKKLELQSAAAGREARNNELSTTDNNFVLNSNEEEILSKISEFHGSEDLEEEGTETVVTVSQNESHYMLASVIVLVTIIVILILTIIFILYKNYQYTGSKSEDGGTGAGEESSSSYPLYQDTPRHHLYYNSGAEQSLHSTPYRGRGPDPASHYYATTDLISWRGDARQPLQYRHSPVVL